MIFRDAIPTWKTGFARHACEVEPHVQAIRESCIGLWAPMLGPTGADVYNVARNNAHGAQTNMVWGPDYITGDGTTSSIAVTASGVPDGFPTAMPITILAWATTANHAEDQTLVNYNASASIKLVLGIHSSALWTAGNYGGSKCNFPSNAGQVNQWQFFAGAYTPTVSSLYFGQNAPSEGTTGIFCADGVQIGYRNYSSTNPWRGDIRYVAILDRWMSHAEYLMLYSDPAALLRRSRRKVLWIPTSSGPPTYTGIGASTATPATSAGVGVYTAPVYTGVGASAAHPATSAGVGVYSAPVYSGVGASAAQPATSSGVGSYTAPVYSGIGASSAQPATSAGVGVYTAGEGSAEEQLYLDPLTAEELEAMTLEQLEAMLISGGGGIFRSSVFHSSVFCSQSVAG